MGIRNKGSSLVSISELSNFAAIFGTTHVPSHVLSTYLLT